MMQALAGRSMFDSQSDLDGTWFEGGVGDGFAMRSEP